MAAHTKQTMHTEEYDEDYEEERAIEKRATLDEEDRLLHHSSWKKKSPSIDRNKSTSIDTQPHQPSHLQASTDIAYYPSIDINPSTSIDINRTTSIDSRPKPKTTVSEKDKFDNEYLTPDEFGIFRDPNGYAKAIDGRTLHVSREDIADILQTANGAGNLSCINAAIQNRRLRRSVMTQLVA